MKGEFSRMTFDPTKRYRGVRMQQGRVQLDADWNEQLDIQRYLDERALRDTVGPTGIPWSQRDAFRVTVVGGALQLGRGVIYVDGILCENPGDGADALDHQPEPPTVDAPLVDGGRYLFYLDACCDLHTALDAPSIRESALGGADTATRDRVSWRVRRTQLGTETAATMDRAWLTQRLHRDDASTGRMMARAVERAPSTEACLVPTAGGYRGLENALYRVEVHAPGVAGEATFKWSRDNGALSARTMLCEPAAETGRYQLSLDGVSEEQRAQFRVGDALELNTDGREAEGLPGYFVVVTSHDFDANLVVVRTGDTETGTVPTWFTTNVPNGHTRRARRWETEPFGIVGSADASDPIELGVATSTGGDGIAVQFQLRGAGATLQFHTGDYWTIPARVGEAHLGAPWDDDAGAAQLPHGVRHHYVPLAVAQYSAATPHWSSAQDLRAGLHFASLPALRHLVDVQDPLPSPRDVGVYVVRVGVASGTRMVPDETVRFSSVTDTLVRAVGDPTWGGTVDVVSQSDGIASCEALQVGSSDFTQLAASLQPSTPATGTHAPRYFVLPPWQRQLITASLVLDFDAERGTELTNGREVMTWRSRCLGERIAVKVDTRPLLLPGAYAGRSAVRFAYPNCRMAIVGDLDTLDTEKVSIYVVGLALGDGASGDDEILIGRQLEETATYRWGLGRKGSLATVQWNAASFTYSPPAGASWRALTVWSHNNCAQNLLWNGHALTTADPAGLSDGVTYASHLGEITLGAGGFDLLRVLVYKREHTPAEIELITSYLSERYRVVQGV